MSKNNKILLLGGSGMLGHKLYQYLSKKFETYVVFRKYAPELDSFGLFNKKYIIDNINVYNFKMVNNLIHNVKPNCIVNCIGIIKQKDEAKINKNLIYINSLLPHLLADTCKDLDCRIIQISTDCVFSGEKGNYNEDDFADADDLYGRTKFLGEVTYENCLTIRTSIIGHSILGSHSLVDWFLLQDGKKVEGYMNAIYTGFPTITICKEFERIIAKFPELNGLYHISSNKISKYELLQKIKNIYNLNVEITPYKDFYCDRSLNSSEYREKTGFLPASWDIMINDMYEDYLWYKTKGLK